MGSGSFDRAAYATYSASTSTKRTEEIYSSRTIHKDLDPNGVTVRESRDSADNPNATPVIVALDVTGSMDRLADVIARAGLGTLFTSILDRKPISDPHVMFMAIGDAHYDHFPLQVSQFEADNRIVEQLTKIYLEKGGGGNGFESYDLPWYFAGFHTVHDSMAKRGKRGYLFTVGDEEAPESLTRAHIKRVCGDDLEAELTPAQMLEIAQRSYDVFHVVIKEGNHARRHLERVVSSWRALLGQRVILLEDHTKLAETIVSAIEVAEGVSAAATAKAWGGSTSAVVLEAVRNLQAGGTTPKMLGRS